jgi:hypothetical protein
MMGLGKGLVGDLGPDDDGGDALRLDAKLDDDPLLLVCMCPFTRVTGDSLGEATEALVTGFRAVGLDDSIGLIRAGGGPEIPFRNSKPAAIP